MESLSSSVCRSCRLRLSNASRSFSSTTHRRMVPPESPAYIDVPNSYQPDNIIPRRQKGVLPVPREIFPANRPDKPSKEYINNATKSPLPQNIIPKEKLTELGRYRVKMAEMRKQHLRDGLTELHKRKQATIARMESRSQARSTEHARLITQAEREDARLTNNSVPQVMQLYRSATPIADDLKAAKALNEAKKANYEKVAETKNQERLEALHSLYMSARSFITTEKQFARAIEEQFDDPELFKSDVGPGQSIWNTGPPDTIKEMIQNARGVEPGMASVLQNVRRSGSSAQAVRYARDQERMKRIAEKLSGGKI